MPFDEEVVFDEALSLTDPSERKDYLDRACGIDTENRTKVESLLQAYFKSEFIDSTQMELASLIQTESDFKSSLIDCRVGKYHVIELIGEGGMGEVYLAKKVNDESSDVSAPLRDAGVSKLVALKVLKLGMDSHQILARFRLEQAALKRLNHPKIAKFLDAGVTETGRAYFAMELIRGIPLTQFCDREKLSIHDRIRLLIQVCEAVSHAQENGLVHRDLKPTNVLVGLQDGEPILRIIDFGVAKALEEMQIDNSVFTRATQLVGTPGYMSPEQIRFSSDVDARSDVFSLGAILYELITGKTPIYADGSKRVHVDDSTSQYDDIPLPSRRVASYERSVTTESKYEFFNSRSCDAIPLVRLVKGDLDWITMKAIRKDREKRYLSPLLLAKDLEAYLENRPVTARGPNFVESIGLWQLRHKKSFRWGSIFSMIAIAMGAFAWAIRVSQLAHIEHHEFVGSVARLESNLSRTVHEALILNVQLANKHLQRNEVVATRQLLSKYKGPDETQSTQFATGYLRNRSDFRHESMRGHRSEILDMDISPDGKSIVSGDKGGDTIIWDRSSRKEVLRLPHVNAEVIRVCFSPDGKTLAMSTSFPDCKVRLWNVSDWSLKRELIGHERTINGLAWSPDSRSIASGDRDGVVRTWSVDDGGFTNPVEKQKGVIQCLSWSRDGAWLAMGIKESGVRVTKFSGKPEPERFIANDGSTPLALAFSNDCQWLAFGGYDGQLTVYDMTTGYYQRLSTERITSIHCIDNSHFVFGTRGQVYSCMYRGESWKVGFSISLDADVGVRSIKSTSDGEEIFLATDSDKIIRCFPSESIVGYVRSNTTSVAVGPEKQSNLILEYGPRGKQGRLYRRDTGEATWTASWQIIPWSRPLYSAQMDRIFIGTHRSDSKARFECNIRSFDSSGKETGKVNHPGSLMGIHLSRDSKYMVSWNSRAEVYVWDLASTEKRILSNDHHPANSAPLFAPNHDLLVMSYKNRLSVLRPGDWQLLRAVDRPSHIHATCFSPQGSWIAVADNEGVTGWTPDMTQQLWTLDFRSAPENSVRTMDISPDGSMLAACCADRTIRIWDIRTRAEILTIPIPRLKSYRFCFTDAQTLQIFDEWACYTISGKPHE